MSHDYLREVPGSEAIKKRIENLSGEQFEVFIADLFKPFEALGWKVWLTQGSSDFGGDIVFANPDGYRHVFQCKLRSDTEKEEGIAAVQQVVAAKAIYKAKKAIVITTAESYSASARKLAEANDVELWALRQIGLLYTASINRDEALLADMGLAVPKREKKFEDEEIEIEEEVKIPALPSFPRPTRTEQSAQLTLAHAPEPAFLDEEKKPKRRVRPLVWIAMAVVSILLIAFFSGRPSPPKGILTSKLPSDAELLHFVKLHDQAWVKAQSSNSPELLKPFRTGTAYEGAAKNIRAQAERGCFFSISINKEPQVFVLNRSFEQIEVHFQKDWTIYEVCKNRTAWKLGLNGPFRVQYTMRPTSEGWKISEAREVRDSSATQQ
ncbi:MAG: restriction endonuclease [Meiothermus sp.]|nr:restriction endonuclease [Meiothermus sp.]